MLASFSVGIISAVLVRDLLVRSLSFSPVANRQFIATDRSSEFFTGSAVDTMLLYVDLGSVSAIRWALENVGSVLQHGFKSAIQAGVWLCHRAGVLVQLVWRWSLRPVVQRIWAMVVIVWYSPLLSAAT